MKRYMLFALLFLLLFITGLISYSKEKSFIICIDPGHGGYDGGAVIDHILESNINLEISFKIKEKLEDYGYDVVLTREGNYHLGGDKFIKKKDLNERLKIINQSNLFISIHQNKFNNPIYSGLEVLYNNCFSENYRLSEILMKQLKIVSNSKRNIISTNSLYLLNNAKVPGCLIECGFMSNQDELQMLLNPNYQNLLASKVLDAVNEYLLY